eukprot:EG_transcript_54542
MQKKVVIPHIASLQSKRSESIAFWVEQVQLGLAGVSLRTKVMRMWNQRSRGRAWHSQKGKGVDSGDHGTNYRSELHRNAAVMRGIQTRERSRGCGPVPSQSKGSCGR